MCGDEKRKRLFTTFAFVIGISLTMEFLSCQTECFSLAIVL